MSDKFEGKVALITGAGSGVGRASALAFAGTGMHIAAADLDADAAGETAAMANNAGVEAIAVRMDVRDRSTVSSAFEHVRAAFGRLDVAHNNAGVGGVFSATAEYPDDSWDDVLAVNLTGVFHCMKHEIPFMIESGGGAIVNTISSGGLIGMPMSAAYVAAKHGVAGLTKTAAIEYAAQNLRINGLCPGMVRTPLTAPFDQETTRKLVGLHPIGRMAEPEEIAAAAVWLCSPQASFVTGAMVPVDGGFTTGVTP